MDSAQEILALGPDFSTQFEFLAQPFHFYPTLLLSGSKGYRFFLPKHTISWFASVLKNQGILHTILKLQPTRDFQSITKQYHIHQYALLLTPMPNHIQMPFTKKCHTLSLQFLTHPETVSAEDLAFLHYYHLVKYNPVMRYLHNPSHQTHIRKTLIIPAVPTEVVRAKAIFDQIPYYRITPSITPPRVTIPTVFDLIIPVELDEELSQQITDHFGEKIRYFGEYLTPDYSFLPYLQFYPHQPRPDIPQIQNGLLGWISSHLN